MSDGETTTAASWKWLVEGYTRARARFVASADKRDEPAERFIPLFETLHWVVAIMEYPEDSGRLRHDEIVRALRYARNRVHHQFANALEARDVPFPQFVTNRPGGSRIRRPPTVLDWFWKPLDRLPEAPPRFNDPEGAEAYRLHLADRPVEEALAHLDALLWAPRDT